ncbi:hypothetical protein RU97_GL001884 [Enterococcus canis]|uniref:Uncharacterized protein n=1 Tax=Enterococcus canis TaxID=214095 RepID=A0A1L8RFI0_9ENTE|nr:hypothetical protein [Enterococcus canis]OJG18487.1 hypothetical protein RU97_GL001884 [Enterococcus canis]
MKLNVKAKPFSYELEIEDKTIQNIMMIVCGTLAVRTALKKVGR